MLAQDGHAGGLEPLQRPRASFADSTGPRGVAEQRAADGAHRYGGLARECPRLGEIFYRGDTFIWDSTESERDEHSFVPDPVQDEGAER